MSNPTRPTPGPTPGRGAVQPPQVAAATAAPAAAFDADLAALSGEDLLRVLITETRRVKAMLAELPKHLASGTAGSGSNEDRDLATALVLAVAPDMPDKPSTFKWGAALAKKLMNDLGWDDAKTEAVMEQVQDGETNSILRNVRILARELFLAAKKSGEDINDKLGRSILDQTLKLPGARQLHTADEGKYMNAFNQGLGDTHPPTAGR